MSFNFLFDFGSLFNIQDYIAYFDYIIILSAILWFWVSIYHLISFLIFCTMHKFRFKKYLFKSGSRSNYFLTQLILAVKFGIFLSIILVYLNIYLSITFFVCFNYFKVHKHNISSPSFPRIALIPSCSILTS